MKNSWFRLYAEAVDDDKLRLLAFEDRWHFVALLCCKCQGVYDGKPETLVRRLAVKIGLQLADMDKLKRRLMEADLIDDDWQPLNWDKRQFVSDNSTERVRKFRAKTARENGDDNGKKNVKRECNVSETPPEQNRTETEQTTTAAAGEFPARAREAIAGDSVSPAATDSPTEKPPPKPASTTAVGDLADWVPSEFARYQLESFGIIAETIESVLPEFRAYWQQRPDRHGLDAKFIRQCQRAKASGATDRPRQSYHDSRQAIVDYLYDFSDDDAAPPWERMPPERCLQ